VDVRAKRGLAWFAGAALLLAACQVTGSAPPSASPSPGGDRLNEPQAKLALLTELGELWYCDPDFYPIAIQDEQDAALERWAEVTADDEVLDAILEHLDLPADRELTDAEKLRAYREWKVLRAMMLEATDDGWRFDVLTRDAPGVEQGHRSVGTISGHGEIDVEQSEPSIGPNCPICLARGTPIDTPAGSIPVERLRQGDVVWTRAADGTRIAAPVDRVGSAPAPPSHRVVHLVLADGREAWVSPGHPTDDGRAVGDLRPGDVLDGSHVVAVDREPYGGGDTFDLLPLGETATYWAAGIPLGSTLDP
jgi:hypothetical protein